MNLYIVMHGKTLKVSGSWIQQEARIIYPAVGGGVSLIVARTAALEETSSGHIIFYKVS